jgi:hypothetical protein
LTGELDATGTITSRRSERDGETPLRLEEKWAWPAHDPGRPGAGDGAGLRAGDRNAILFAGMTRFCAQLAPRRVRGETDVEFVEDKIANSAAGAAYRSSLPHPFDANWLSLQVECAEASMLLEDAVHAATLYERLEAYAGMPATAGRGVTSYGAVDPGGRLAIQIFRERPASP